MNQQNEVVISLVVPVYNCDRFLEKTLISIANQSFKNFEVLLVNDGSTDKSLSVIEQFTSRDYRFKLINKENGGVSNARNVGIEHCIGKYVCFCDGDDILSTDYLSYLYKLIKENNSDVALTTKMFSNYNSEQSKQSAVKNINSYQAIEMILKNEMPIGVYSKIFKKTILEETKFDTRLFIGEGFNFNIDAFAKSKAITISNKKIYFYRLDNANSATSDFSISKGINSLFALDVIKGKIIGSFKGNEQRRLLTFWQFAKWRTSSLIFSMGALISKKENPAFEISSLKKSYLRTGAIKSLFIALPIKEWLRAFLFSVNLNLVPIMIKIKRRKAGITNNQEINT